MALKKEGNHSRRIRPESKGEKRTNEELCLFEENIPKRRLKTTDGGSGTLILSSIC